MKKQVKTVKKTATKAENRGTARASTKKTPKKEGRASVPLMTTSASTSVTRTKSRRNLSSMIERTDRFKNIDDGLVPFKYTKDPYGNSTINVKDAIILCQKAYYNFSVFRNIIDLMTEFSVSNIYLRGGSNKSRKFFDALFRKINLWNFQDRFFREYFRSGNVFVYRFDATLKQSEINKVTQVFAKEERENVLRNLKKNKNTIPSRYMILNPSDIQVAGSLTFGMSDYLKRLTDYELQRLRVPRTEEDLEVFNSLDKEAQEQIKDKQMGYVSLRLDTDKVIAVFYKKQDYEPFAVPMGYPVLEDINFKAEMKKMDMAVARTMQQAILVITMGDEPDKGGVNQENLKIMQELFENQSVGRVLIADYTTKAQFVIPQIADLLDPKKYEMIDRDIHNGLNDILIGGEKFANQQGKIEVFMARLKHARETFLNDFLLPEMKRIAKNLGFKNYPKPYFDEIELKQNFQMNRVYSRLIELGILTPEEGSLAIQKGRLPDKESSIESQKEYMELRKKGLYEPLLNKGGEEKGEGKPGRSPDSKGIPQESKNVSPIGEGTGVELYSVSRIKENMVLSQKLQAKVETELKRNHKMKKLNEQQISVAHEISDIIMANEPPDNWGVKIIKEYCKNPVDKNIDKIKEIQGIACEHNINNYVATLLYMSKEEDKK